MPFIFNEMTVDFQAVIGARVVCGEVTNDLPLQLESHMPEGGVIFSDGIEADYLPFNAGTRATIRVAQQKTNPVIA